LGRPLFPRLPHRAHCGNLDELMRIETETPTLQRGIAVENGEASIGTQPEAEDVWRKVLFMLQLIPCRSLNSLLLADEIEREMEVISQTHDFGYWDHHILYVFSLLKFLFFTNS
jgi:hypothetical protein